MTGRFDSPEYDECRRWIEKKREKHVSWDLIKKGGKDSVNYLEVMLRVNQDTNDWPEISASDWLSLAEEMEYYEAHQERIEFRGNDGALFDLNQDNCYAVPQNQYSGWQTYVRKLKDQGWKEESLKNLEEASIGILKRLKADTTECGAVKGLVIGHVQSGKTANMEALMEMASDYGWNMFIILSGTIESLRQQTLRRMLKDFNPGGNLTWHVVDNPDKHNPAPQYMDFSPSSKLRYFAVCLKNQKRLKNLIDWINANKPSHDSMRMLIIDDEADQASISNTVKLSDEEEQERKGINKLIVSLVNDCHYKEDKTKGKARAINYVMYTATPYANFLNESDEESLYPKDFIWTLKTPKEYIGPEQIFGSDEPELASEDGLNIKRIVSEEDLRTIQDIYEGTEDEPPASLRKSICWFICSVAVMRYWNYQKPVSMLVHTSQKQVNHAAVAEVISTWIDDHMDADLLDMCREEYIAETSALTREDWLQQIGRTRPDEDTIRDYPAWEEIADLVREILSIEMTHIKMDEDGDLHYHRGLHLVIDNCANNGIRNGEDHVRLAYPESDSPDCPDYATAFIVVGGSTLSRGLTIEGLVSTFFLRASCQADTLMQMGRWFGYRRGYELLPRIWMTSDTADKFRFLSRLETDLRDDLKKYMLEGVKPSEYGPRLLATPKVSWLRLTSKKHMMNAEEADMDYAGARPQTYIFDRDKAVQEKNIALTEQFIAGLPGEPAVSDMKNCLFWRGVTLKRITDFLTGGFSFSGRTQVFDEIGTFCDWLKSIPADSLNDWSVIIAGKDEVKRGSGDPENVWNIRNWQVGKVNRSERRKNSDEYRDYIDIGALRSLKDGLADVEEKYFRNKVVAQQNDVNNIRSEAHMDMIPQLIIYRIDKNSRPRNDSAPNPNASSYRAPLDIGSDIIGLYITIPGDQVNRNFVKKLTVRMPVRSSLEDDYEN